MVFWSPPPLPQADALLPPKRLRIPSAKNTPPATPAAVESAEARKPPEPPPLGDDQGLLCGAGASGDRWGAYWAPPPKRPPETGTDVPGRKLPPRPAPYCCDCDTASSSCRMRASARSSACC